MQTVLSLDADKTWVPSGEKTADCTDSEWHLSSASGSPVAAFRCRLFCHLMQTQHGCHQVRRQQIAQIQSGHVIPAHIYAMFI
jgi:hypothetical protein